MVLQTGVQNLKVVGFIQEASDRCKMSSVIVLVVVLVEQPQLLLLLLLLLLLRLFL